MISRSTAKKCSNKENESKENNEVEVPVQKKASRGKKETVTALAVAGNHALTDSDLVSNVVSDSNELLKEKANENTKKSKPAAKKNSKNVPKEVPLETATNLETKVSSTSAAVTNTAENLKEIAQPSEIRQTRQLTRLKSNSQLKTEPTTVTEPETNLEEVVSKKVKEPVKQRGKGRAKNASQEPTVDAAKIKDEKLTEVLEIDKKVLETVVEENPKAKSKSKAAKQPGSSVQDVVSTVSDSIEPLITNFSQAMAPKPKFKTKASQEAFVSAQLNILTSLLKENLAPYTQELTHKISTVLDTLSNYNNKISMFLDDKRYITELLISVGSWSDHK